MKVSLKKLNKDIIVINNNEYNNFPINLNFRDDFEENPNNTNIYGKYIESYIENDSKDFFKVLNSSIFNIFREYICKLNRYKNSPNDYRHYYSYGDVISQIKEWIKLNNPKQNNESDNHYQQRLKKIMMNPKSITLRFFPRASFMGRLIRAYSDSLPNEKKPKLFTINGLVNGYGVSRFDYMGFFCCDLGFDREVAIFDKYLLNGSGNEDEWKKFISFANEPKNMKYQSLNKNDFIRDISNMDAHRNHESVKLQIYNIDLYMKLIANNPKREELFKNQNRDIYSDDRYFIQNYIKFSNSNVNVDTILKDISREKLSQKLEHKNKVKKENEEILLAKNTVKSAKEVMKKNDNVNKNKKKKKKKKTKNLIPKGAIVIPPVEHKKHLNKEQIKKREIARQKRKEAKRWASKSNKNNFGKYDKPIFFFNPNDK